MSLKSQAKVLRILQERKFERVGGGRTVEVDVRIIAATNKDLEEEIRHSNFRADLFYRLNVIPLLTADFLRQFSRKGLGEKQFADSALSMLMRHSWPGNIRELRNMVERLVIMTPGQLITAEDVALFLQPGPARSTPSVCLPTWNQLGFKEARRQFEHDYLCKKLAENSGNVSKTAEKIGVERSHLHKKLKALGIRTAED